MKKEFKTISCPWCSGSGKQHRYVGELSNRVGLPLKIVTEPCNKCDGTTIITFKAGVISE